MDLDRARSERVGPHAARFHALATEIAVRLPLRLDRFVSPTLVGFAVINSLTFGLDVGLLTLLHGRWGLALPAALSISYITAFAASFVLNRWLNFRSHAPVGRQAAIYAVVIVINYVAFILGLVTALSAAGVEYDLSRLCAGLCEAVYMYLALRLIVFRVRA